MQDSVQVDLDTGSILFRPSLPQIGRIIPDRSLTMNDSETAVLHLEIHCAK